MTEKQKKIEHPDLKVEVFPDHLKIRDIAGYNVRIDEHGAKASKEVKGIRVCLENMGDFKFADKSWVNLPSANLDITLYLQTIPDIASLKPGGLSKHAIWVPISLKFTIDGREMDMQGFTQGESCAVKNEFIDPTPKGHSKSLDCMVIEDAFGKKLSGDIKMLADKIDWILKNDENVKMSLKALHIVEVAEVDKLIKNVGRLTKEVEAIGEDALRDPNLLLPIALEAKKLGGEVLVRDIGVQLLGKALAIRKEVEEGEVDEPARTDLMREAKKLETLGNLFREYEGWGSGKMR
jgi:hypothetical protein